VDLAKEEIITGTSASKLPTPHHSNRNSVPIQQHISPNVLHAPLDFTKTPRSLEINRSDNTILRMPDSAMMMVAMERFHDMLEDIYEDPEGFGNYVEERRGKLVEDSLVHAPSPINLQTSNLSDYSSPVPVGKGRFSTVYSTTKRSNNTQYALKKIKLTSTSADLPDKNFLTKCLKEVGLLRSIVHPNIVKYHDCFLDNTDTLYIVLEWAGGGDLKGLITKCRTNQTYLKESDIWSYFAQCSEAVRHMHINRIIHRDIKPSNVLILSCGRLVLGDLGLGRYLGTESLLAFSQVGTPLYMSPEVLRGEGHDFASDVWSLGCLLYELTMLKTPFQSKGLTMDRLFMKIIAGEFTDIPPPFSSRLSGLCRDLINVDASKRPSIDVVASAALLNRTSESLQESGGSIESEASEGKESEHSDDNDYTNDNSDDDESYDASHMSLGTSQPVTTNTMASSLPHTHSLPSIVLPAQSGGVRSSVGGRRVSFDVDLASGNNNNNNNNNNYIHNSNQASSDSYESGHDDHGDKESNGSVLFDDEELRLMDELVLTDRRDIDESHPSSNQNSNSNNSSNSSNSNNSNKSNEEEFVPTPSVDSLNSKMDNTAYEPGLSATVSIMQSNSTNSLLPPVSVKNKLEGYSKDDSFVGQEQERKGSGFLRRLSGLISVGRNKKNSKQVLNPVKMSPSKSPRKGKRVKEERARERGKSDSGLEGHS
jgi:NIMA (never in mitosis gene a)-related kinase